MKQLILLLIICTILFSCSKDDTPQPTPAVDYSQYKIKSATYSRINYTSSGNTYSYDTSSFTYEGTTISYESHPSPGNISRYVYTLNNNIYSLNQYNNGALSPQKTYYTLNANNYADTFRLESNATVTQSGKYQYNADGMLAREIAYFTGYTNESQNFYENGNILFKLTVRTSSSPSIAPAKDSVVAEYYPNLMHRASYYYRGLPSTFFGKPTKNLIKKYTYYDLLNNKNIRQTMEYNYEVNEIGLVTKSIVTLYTQPGNIPGFTETTSYTYYNL